MKIHGVPPHNSNVSGILPLKPLFPSREPRIIPTIHYLQHLAATSVLGVVLPLPLSIFVSSAPAHTYSALFRLKSFYLTLFVLAASKHRLPIEATVCVPPSFILLPHPPPNYMNCHKQIYISLLYFSFSRAYCTVPCKTPV